MAYMNQEKKAAILALVKPVLKKFGVKASFAVSNHSTIVMTVKSSSIDFISNFNLIAGENSRGRDYFSAAKDSVVVNPYWYDNHFDGVALEFLSEVLPLLNTGNYDNSDVQTDYFDKGFYVDVNIGKWNKPYVLA